jgi:hypothetical protein
MDGDERGLLLVAGAEGVVAGMEKSRRSFRPDDGAGLDAAAGAGEEKEEKSSRAVYLGCEVFGAFWLGVGSKKPPPPPNMFDAVEVEGGGGDRVFEYMSKPAKGDGLGGGGAGCELKERLLKASFKPPKFDCWGDCWVCGRPGELRPPKDSWRVCCWACG